jgi:ectoine hydroxylase-related dioxygenase (phytanoyl-CoA dioxygenase family)
MALDDRPERKRKSIGDAPLSDLPVLGYPALTEDLEVAKANIDEFGIALVANALSPDEVAVLDARLREQAAGETKLGIANLSRGDEGFGARPAEEERVSCLLWNLVNKGDCFLPLIDHPKSLPLVQHILGKRLLLGSLGAHMNGPGNEQMPLHQDQWPLIPHHLDFCAFTNTLWLVTPNSPENGGTRMVPGSHKWPAVDPRAMNSKEGQALARSVTAPAGTLIVYDGRVWHGNGLNRSESVRSNIAIPYAQPWVRPQENHQYSLREEVYEKLTPLQRSILGFGHFGTLGGHDGSSVSPRTFDRNRESTGYLTTDGREP